MCIYIDKLMYGKSRRLMTSALPRPHLFELSIYVHARGPAHKPILCTSGLVSKIVARDSIRGVPRRCHHGTCAWVVCFATLLLSTGQLCCTSWLSQIPQYIIHVL